MSYLSWNCRGLGNPQTEHELVALVTNKDPKMVFLMETKVEKYVLERVGRKIQYPNLFVAPRVNTGDGLALFWKHDFDVDVQSFSVNHIDAIINHGVDDAWRSRDSMENLKLPTRKTHGHCYVSYVRDILCLGFV